MKISDLKFRELKFWQFFALISGAIIALAMGLASVSYSATLGSDEPAFPILPVTNAQLFACLALAFELAMIASVFGFWHWHWCRRGRNSVAAIFCLAIFAISSTYSVHAVHGYIALNVTKAESRDTRSLDVSGSLKRELDEAQAHLSALNVSRLKARGRRRAALNREADEQRRIIIATRSRLASTKIVGHVSPMAGLEWFLALSLWWMNATGWTAWFGNRSRSDSYLSLELGAPYGAREGAQHEISGSCNVTAWLATHMTSRNQGAPEHCAQLYKHYSAWCAANDATPLADRKFYARLIELGARKFRDGRNGPMKYALPQSPPPNGVPNGKLGA